MQSVSGRANPGPTIDLGPLLLRDFDSPDRNELIYTIREILTSEKRYCESLRQLLNTYYIQTCPDRADNSCLNSVDIATNVINGFDKESQDIIDNTGEFSDVFSILGGVDEESTPVSTEFMQERKTAEITTNSCSSSGVLVTSGNAAGNTPRETNSGNSKEVLRKRLISVQSKIKKIGQPFSEEVWNSVFGGLDAVYAISFMTLRTLSVHFELARKSYADFIKEEQSGTAGKNPYEYCLAVQIGKIFCTFIERSLMTYKFYVAKYDRAVTNLRDAKKNTDVSRRLKEIMNYTCGVDLESLLIKPIQKVPRYVLILNKVQKLYQSYQDIAKKQHPDMAALMAAIKLVDTHAHVIDKNIDEHKNLEQVRLIGESIMKCNQIDTIVQPGRKFIKMGIVTKVCRKADKPRVMILFSDALVYCIEFGLSMKNTIPKNKKDKPKSATAADTLSSTGLGSAGVGMVGRRDSDTLFGGQISSMTLASTGSIGESTTGEFQPSQTDFTSMNQDFISNEDSDIGSYGDEDEDDENNSSGGNNDNNGNDNDDCDNENGNRLKIGRHKSGSHNVNENSNCESLNSSYNNTNTSISCSASQETVVCSNKNNNNNGVSNNSNLGNNGLNNNPSMNSAVSSVSLARGENSSVIEGSVTGISSNNSGSVTNLSHGTASLSTSNAQANSSTAGTLQQGASNNSNSITFDTFFKPDDINFNKRKLIFRQLIPLKDCRVIANKYDDTQFQILTSSNTKNMKSYLFMSNERNAWYEIISECIRKSKPVNYDENQIWSPIWIPDSKVKSCQVCYTKFTPVIRKHHCRACGSIICNSCSKAREKMSEYAKLLKIEFLSKQINDVDEIVREYKKSKEYNKKSTNEESERFCKTCIANMIRLNSMYGDIIVKASGTFSANYKTKEKKNSTNDFEESSSMKSSMDQSSSYDPNGQNTLTRDCALTPTVLLTRSSTSIPNMSAETAQFLLSQHEQAPSSNKFGGINVTPIMTPIKPTMFNNQNSATSPPTTPSAASGAYSHVKNISPAIINDIAKTVSAKNTDEMKFIGAQANTPPYYKYASPENRMSSIQFGKTGQSPLMTPPPVPARKKVVSTSSYSGGSTPSLHTMDNNDRDATGPDEFYLLNNSTANTNTGVSNGPYQASSATSSFMPLADNNASTAIHLVPSAAPPLPPPKKRTVNKAN